MTVAVTVGGTVGVTVVLLRRGVKGCVLFSRPVGITREIARARGRGGGGKVSTAAVGLSAGLSVGLFAVVAVLEILAARKPGWKARWARASVRPQEDVVGPRMTP